MPITRREIEVLLDTPNRHDYVVSAYADLTIQDGFSRHVERHLKNQARAAGEALAETRARKALEENLDVIRQAVAERNHGKARGLAVFSSVARGFRQVLPLDFAVENHLVIDEEPFVLPLLEHWYGDPSYLIVLADSDEAHLFEARHGHPDRVVDLVRPDATEEFQRDKPKFTYKKRFAQTRHERLFGAEDDRFLKAVVDAVREHWNGHFFAGLILLGQPPITAALRKQLPRELAQEVIGESALAMTVEPELLTQAVAPLAEAHRAGESSRRLAELRERRKENHLVAAGPTEVLDALQQGRAVEVLLGPSKAIAGARCNECDYRLGAVVATCPYCNGTTRTVNAVQDVLTLAMRQKVPVFLIGRGSVKDDPMKAYGDVAAFLRAEANWAPDPATAAASEGHA